MDDAWYGQMHKAGSSLIDSLLEEAAFHTGRPERYESPIEHALAVAMYVMFRVRHREVVLMAAERGKTEVELRQLVSDLRTVSGGLTMGRIFPQAWIGDYRVDFLILHDRGIDGIGGVIIECDGHEFHERTKEQAARDKARDRNIQERGYKVLRFTGSEIWRDPFACADTAMGLAASIALDSEYARNLIAMGHTEDAIKVLGGIQ